MTSHKRGNNKGAVREENCVPTTPSLFATCCGDARMYLKKETSTFDKKFIGVCQTTGALLLECVVFEIMMSARCRCYQFSLGARAELSVVATGP